MQPIEQVLLQIALDLSAKRPDEQHYQKLIHSVQQVLPCDACALFVLDQSGHLKPVATSGLAPAVMGQRFAPAEHPRLAEILSSRHPVRFSADSHLPDPFDGLLSLDQEVSLAVHSCMGCGLYVEDELIGALTLDAAAPSAFEGIDNITVETLAALAAATLRNVALFEALQKANRHQQSVTRLLIEEARAKEGELVGNSPVIQQLRSAIAMVAPTDYAVLIMGETGVGKELVAHQLHAQSRRSDKPMVYVNCAALVESIAESELFGHVRGAFTGAHAQRAGKFELADGGTIFLDEIGELPLLLQAKLLRVIQQGEVQRVGSDSNLRVDVRVIAATNRNLLEEVQAGRFRSDLYHRLNVFPISVPPLREREGDIGMLAGYLLEQQRLQFHRPSLHLHPRALQWLERQSWPGNVRELQHCLMRASLQALQHQQPVVRLEHLGISDNLPPPVSSLPESPISLREAVDAYQKQLIEQALAQHQGVWSRAAHFLGMDRGNLYKLGKRLGLTPQ